VASVRRLALEDCVRFHRDLCARDTLLVGVAGDATETEARRALLDRLEALPERAAVARPAWPDAAPPRGRRALLVDKPDRSQAQIYLGHFGPKPGRDHHDGLYVSTVAFGGTLSARLMQEIRVKRGWSYGAYAQLARSRRDDAFYLWTFPKSADLGPCLALELDLLRAVAQDGVAPQELELARGYLVGSSVFLVDTPADRLERRIEVETLGFPPDYYAAFRRRVESVTLESARAATAACVHPDDLVVAVLCTAAQARDAVRKALGDGAAVDVVAFDDDTL
jgi:zinc protease